MASFSIKNLFPEDPNVKNLLWWILSFAIFFYGVGQMVSAGNNLYNRGITAVEHTATFSGEGKVKAVPDTARFEAGLITEGKDSISVQGQNSDKINQVIKYLKEQGVAGEDIKTSQYNLSPKYDYIKGKTILSGYILNQSLTVTVRDINAAGKILDGAVVNGANQINSVSLFVDKPEEIKARAKLAAVQQAQEKAKSAALAAGFRLGRLAGFTENAAGEPKLYYEAAGRGGAGLSAPPEIEPGSQEIVVNVSLTYQIR